MEITKHHLKKFGEIIICYQDKTEFPEPDNWLKKSNNELWLWLVGQVIVVGSAAANDRFQNSQELKSRLSFSRLEKLTDDDHLQKEINAVLRNAGVRYASNELKKCQKSKALVHNFRYISNFKGGFKGILKYLSNLNGEYAELDRVTFLMHHFKFIKNKSARDFLMNMGMNHNTLALDIRIQNIFKHLGIDFPTQAQLSMFSVYNKTEKEIVLKLCEPMNILPVKLDRILFQNYKGIIEKSKRP